MADRAIGFDAVIGSKSVFMTFNLSVADWAMANLRLAFLLECFITPLQDTGDKHFDMCKVTEDGPGINGIAI